MATVETEYLPYRLLKQQDTDKTLIFYKNNEGLKFLLILDGSLIFYILAIVAHIIMISLDMVIRFEIPKKWE
jgi:hypothetical protein